MARISLKVHGVAWVQPMSVPFDPVRYQSASSRVPALCCQPVVPLPGWWIRVVNSVWPAKVSSATRWGLISMRSDGRTSGGSSALYVQ